MKKSAMILLILSVIFISGASFAEDQNMEDMGMMGGKGKMGGKGGMMHESPKMVTTSDGGVIILAGRKLSKYDGLLNLVKEVELKGGPSPKRMDEMKSEETPLEDASFKPMDDAQIDAMMEQFPPDEAPAVPEPTPSQ